jgi:hypothetical protein
MANKEYKTPAELIANLEDNKGLTKGTASSAHSSFAVFVSHSKLLVILLVLNRLV